MHTKVCTGKLIHFRVLFIVINSLTLLKEHLNRNINCKPSNCILPLLKLNFNKSNSTLQLKIQHNRISHIELKLPYEWMSAPRTAAFSCLLSFKWSKKPSSQISSHKRCWTQPKCINVNLYRININSWSIEVTLSQRCQLIVTKKKICMQKSNFRQ